MYQNNVHIRKYVYPNIYGTEMVIPDVRDRSLCPYSLDYWHSAGWMVLDVVTSRAHRGLSLRVHGLHDSRIRYICIYVHDI